ncbi:hypothetical protein CDL15_Pgr009030 [Punica granatum]|uniref:Sugar phosphate transporter domain-containing protein n=1 Tax=Punica granatum TaxID=22663 RepID=A0A218VZG8_PUNGR|nr:hypothetical protein CDL15_Pgr009030 [Punica granatum]
MQSAAFSPLSPSVTFRKSRRSHKLIPSSGSSSGSRSDPIRLSVSSRTDRIPPDAVSGLSASALPRRSWFSSPVSSSFSPVSGPRPWSGVHNFGTDRESDRFEVRAAPVLEVSGEGEQSGSLSRTLELGLLFGLWYIFNIYFNIYNKQVLKVFHYPTNATLVQLAVGSVLVLFMWTFNLHKRPKVSGAQLLAILPLAVVHILGNFFTNMSLGKVSVSFTHTIKAMEPFFSVILSAMFLGEDSMDNITLFSIITVMSFFLLFPVTYFTEGFKYAPSFLQSAAESGINVKQLLTRSLLAALCFHAYQQVSYMILQRVSPVTHSVGNCVKRVVVIVSSVIFFKTAVLFINSLGTGIALAGVFLYSRVKRIKPKQKAA